VRLPEKPGAAAMPPAGEMSMLRIICIEEHANDPGIGMAAAAVMMEQAPYMELCQTERIAVTPHNPHRPGQVPMTQAVPLANEIGKVRLKAMDEQAIAMQVISLGQPTQMVPADRAIEMARAANDRLAASVAAHPDRFAGFATLPWQHPQAAADELTRAVNELGFKGALLMGRPGESFLDDPRYAPLLQRLNTLRVPLYVHPGVPAPAVKKAYYDGLSPEVVTQFALAGWGWHHEAGVQTLRLILSGAFDTYSDFRVISGHWGEMVPFYLARLDDLLPKAVTGLSRTISETYRAQIWVTPSGMFDLPHFKFIHEVLGADRIIWSNDYPYLTLDGTRAFLEQLPVSDADREKIAFRNAEGLLRLTGKRSGSA
jgi:predicted TIM-barrel fold metal-dependent hydrolase